MKLSFAFLVLLLLILGNEIDARTGPGEYWKAVMKDEAMPEAINGLFDHQEGLSSNNNPTDQENKFWSHFKRDFDVTPNAIIYHPHHKHPTTKTTAAAAAASLTPAPEILDHGQY